MKQLEIPCYHVKHTIFILVNAPGVLNYSRPYIVAPFACLILFHALLSPADIFCYLFIFSRKPVQSQMCCIFVVVVDLFMPIYCFP